MRPGKMIGSCVFAVLMLGAVLTGAAQDANEAFDADACVAAAVADWSPPQTLEEATSLQEALAELVAGCGTEAEAETEGAEEGLSDADNEFPRTMYVTSRVPRINVRRYASTSSAIVGTLAYAAPVEVLARARGASYRGNAVWWRVGEGYVHSLLLGEAQPAPLSIPTPTPLPVTAPQQQETQDNQPSQQQQQPQQQGGRQQQEQQSRQQREQEREQRPPPEDQPPPDEETKPPDTVQPPEGDLIFVPLTEEEWEEARRRLFGDDG